METVTNSVSLMSKQMGTQTGFAARARAVPPQAAAYTSGLPVSSQDTFDAPAIAPRALGEAIAVQMPSARTPGLTSEGLMDAIVKEAIDKAGEEGFSHLLTVGAFVEDAHRLAIQSRAYFNLSCLMHTDPCAAIHSLEVVDGKPRVTTEKLKDRKPETWSEWVSLFSTFAGIYCEAHPTEATGLFSYQRIIQELSWEGGVVWRDYDELFRNIKARHMPLPWSETSQKMLGMIRRRVTTMATAVPLQAARPFRAPFEIPADCPSGSCHIFYVKGYCTKGVQCKYKHICKTCKQSGHSFSACGKQGGLRPV